jgi:cell division protein FtsW (lipid II flippase)
MDAFKKTGMTIYHWILAFCFLWCLTVCTYYFIQALWIRRPKEYARPKGKVLPAAGYAFTKAMSPSQKETAYLHLPTYTGGLVYHLGTFLALLLMGMIFFHYYPPRTWTLVMVAFLAVSFLSGASIFIKRIIKKKIRALSNPDDYLSNLLVTLFHGLTAAALLIPGLQPVLLIYSALLFIYIPVGKLKHVVYFFASRTYLSFFYGRRGVWPVEKEKA